MYITHKANQALLPYLWKRCALPFTTFQWNDYFLFSTLHYQVVSSILSCFVSVSCLALYFATFISIKVYSCMKNMMGAKMFLNFSLTFLFEGWIRERSSRQRRELHGCVWMRCQTDRRNWKTLYSILFSYVIRIKQFKKVRRSTWKHAWVIFWADAPRGSRQK